MREEISSEPCILERDQNGIIRIKHCEELFIADREAFQKLLDERNNFLIHRDKLIANLQIMKTPKTNTPETDQVEAGYDAIGVSVTGIASLCRKLEQERDEARREAVSWRDGWATSHVPLPWENSNPRAK